MQKPANLCHWGGEIMSILSLLFIFRAKQYVTHNAGKGTGHKEMRAFLGYIIKEKQTDFQQ